MRFYKKNKPAKIQIKTKSIFVCLYIFSANSFFRNKSKNKMKQINLLFLYGKKYFLKFLAKTNLKRKKYKFI